MEQTPETNKTELVQEQKKTRMVSPGRKKAYKIEIMRDSQVTTPDGQTRTALAGEVVEVTEDCARELLGVGIRGMFIGTGEIEGGAKKEIIYRAVPYKGDKKPEQRMHHQMDLDALYE